MSWRTNSIIHFSVPIFFVVCNLNWYWQLNGSSSSISKYTTLQYVINLYLTVLLHCIIGYCWFQTVASTYVNAFVMYIHRSGLVNAKRVTSYTTYVQSMHPSLFMACLDVFRAIRLIYTYIKRKLALMLFAIVMVTVTYKLSVQVWIMKCSNGNEVVGDWRHWRVCSRMLRISSRPRVH